MAVSRTGSGPFLLLDGCSGSFTDLVTVKTSGKYRNEMISVIKRDLANWMTHHNFEQLRKEKLDIAIVASITPTRMSHQDVDNISKVVLDGLKESFGENRFLFHDDNQVVRLLIWKFEQETIADYNTDTLTISFRKHDPTKQMILVEPGVI